MSWMRSQRLSGRKLEIILEELEKKENPNLILEQYPTPPRIASEMLMLAFNRGDIEGKIVHDLGCGTGILAIGAALLGAEKVIGVDVDPVSVEIARRNSKRLGVEVEWIVSPIEEYFGKGDTVLQNPPFGVRKKGADMLFLMKALEVGKIIYSLHKAGNRNFIEGKISSRGKVLNVIPMMFQMRRVFPFHREEIHEFPVELYVIRRTKDEEKRRS